MIFQRILMCGAASLALAANAQAAEIRPVTIDDVTKIEYRITLAGQTPIAKAFAALNPDFATSSRGEPLDAPKAIDVHTLSAFTQKAVAQAHADVDGNGFLNTAEVVRLAIVVLGRRAVPQGSDPETAVIELVVDGKPLESAVNFANKQQSIGLNRLIEATQKAPSIGPVMKDLLGIIAEANVSATGGGGGGY